MCLRLLSSKQLKPGKSKIILLTVHDCMHLTLMIILFKKMHMIQQVHERDLTWHPEDQLCNY